MSHLARELAPITTDAWKEIDREAARTLKRTLAARRLVDFSGPHGWQLSTLALGSTYEIEGPMTGVEAELRSALALVELRVPFTLARSDLEAISRGATDADLSAVTAAARTAAHAEDRTVFDGLDGAGIEGLIDQGADSAMTLSDDYEQYPKAVAAGLTLLRKRGIDGPYSLALGPRCFEGLTETVNQGGYPVMKLVEQQIDGRIVWASTLDGALLLSTRGGDFELQVGQDYSIGYRRHDPDAVDLYIEETLTFLCRTPEAVVPLRYANAPG